MSICLRLKLNINYIPKDWLYKIQVSRRTRANNKRLPKWDAQVPKYRAMGSSSRSADPAAKTSVSVRLWG